MGTSTSEFNVEGKKLLEKVKELLHEGNVRKILITSKSGKRVAEIPVNLGVVVTLFAPILVALGVLGAATDFYKVTVERDEVDEKKKESKKESKVTDIATAKTSKKKASSPKTATKKTTKKTTSSTSAKSKKAAAKASE